MRFVKVLGLLSFLSVPAKAETTLGVFQLNHSSENDKLVLVGPAADALYDSLSQRSGVSELPCTTETIIVAEPMVCIRRNNEQTVCQLVVAGDKTNFELPSFCDRPDPSIIGVGNWRPGLDGNNLPRTKDPLEHIFDRGLPRTLINDGLLRDLLNGGKPKDIFPRVNAEAGAMNH